VEFLLWTFAGGVLGAVTAYLLYSKVRSKGGPGGGGGSRGGCWGRGRPGRGWCKATWPEGAGGLLQDWRRLGWAVTGSLRTGCARPSRRAQMKPGAAPSTVLSPHASAWHLLPFVTMQDVAASYAVGALGGLLYLRLLGRSVDSLGGDGGGGGLGQPRLLVPVILVLVFNR
jgi:hypothetical protein